MLIQPKIRWITHGPFYHLGDIVNIVQQLHNMANEELGYYRIFSRTEKCSCCGVNTSKMLKEVVGLLDTKLWFTKDAPDSWEEYTPAWTKKHVPNPWDSRPYVRAKRQFPKRDHVVCQFDGRSQGDKIPYYDQILKIIDPKMINIGDKKLPCRNETKLDLLTKFRYIASAKLYIGVDSGLTHLALMTDTPVVLVHPRNWDARRFYPETKQIEFRAV